MWIISLLRISKRQIKHSDLLAKNDAPLLYHFYILTILHKDIINSVSDCLVLTQSDKETVTLAFSITHVDKNCILYVLNMCLLIVCILFLNNMGSSMCLPPFYSPLTKELMCFLFLKTRLNIWSAFSRSTENNELYKYNILVIRLVRSEGTCYLFCST